VRPFVLVNLGTYRTGLGTTEKSELGSFPVAGGGWEAGMFCTGEVDPVAEFTGSVATG
jgi:hypothetical protein